MGKTNSKEKYDSFGSKRRDKSNSVHIITEPIKFEPGIQVKTDSKGRLIGMPEMWVDLLEMSPEIIAETVKQDDLDENIRPEKPDDILINEIKNIDAGKFTLYMKSQLSTNEEEYNIEIDENSKVGITGLPESWNNELEKGKLTKEEIQEDPTSVLDMLDWLEKVKSGSIRPLPTNSEYKKLEEESIVFSKSNPQDDYIILDVLGQGGFGKVYRTVQIEDQNLYAMKMIDVTSKKQKIYIGNEITIMKSINHK